LSYKNHIADQANSDADSLANKEACKKIKPVIYYIECYVTFFKTICPHEKNIDISLSI
jgi:hypothetical protein